MAAYERKLNERANRAVGHPVIFLYPEFVYGWMAIICLCVICSEHTSISHSVHVCMMPFFIRVFIECFRFRCQKALSQSCQSERKCKYNCFATVSIL